MWHSNPVERRGISMIRRLLTIAAALSLSLCVATIVLWVRSYVAADSIRWNLPPHGGVSFLSSTGRFTLAMYAGVEGMVGGFQHLSQSPFDFDDQTARWFLSYHNWLGFGFGTGFADAGPVIAPYWFVALLTCVSPLCLFLSGRKSRRRQTLGLCLSCGYDLRASEDRCPECGTPITAKAEAA
jgi:hypothetical protein